MGAILDHEPGDPMDVWEAIAPMVVAIVMFLTIGGVLVLRPIAKHLGAYLEALTRQQLEGDRQAEMHQLRDILETIDQRLHLLEERQDFNDRLLQERARDGEFPKQLERPGDARRPV